MPRTGQPTAGRAPWGVAPWILTPTSAGYGRLASPVRSSCMGLMSLKPRSQPRLPAPNFGRGPAARTKMPIVESGGIRFNYEISGEAGPLVAFQHGLGGDVS